MQKMITMRFWLDMDDNNGDDYYDIDDAEYNGNMTMMVVILKYW